MQFIENSGIFEPICLSDFSPQDVKLQCFAPPCVLFLLGKYLGDLWCQVLPTQIVVCIGPRDSPGVSRHFGDCPTCLGFFLFWRISGWCPISNRHGWPSNTYIIHTRDSLAEASSLRIQYERKQLRLMGICLATQPSTSYLSISHWLLPSTFWNLIHPARSFLERKGFAEVFSVSFNQWKWNHGWSTSPPLTYPPQK